MKKTLFLFLLGTSIVVLPASARANSYDSDDAGHPLRIIAYLVHPIGVALQEYIFRPVHNWISEDETRGFWFGHQTHRPHAPQAPSANARTTQSPREVAQARPPAPAPAAPAPESLPPAPEPVPLPSPSADDLMVVYFDYDISEIRSDQAGRIDLNVKYLEDFPEVKILIEGHCDERGSDQYNYALGERRAKAVADYLISKGISSDRIETVSRGRERPASQSTGEAGWSRNRRAEFKFVD